MSSRVMALPWHAYWAALPPIAGREAEPPGGRYLAGPSNEETMGNRPVIPTLLDKIENRL